MAELVLVRKGSEYTVEDPFSACAATDISETEQKYKIDEEIGRINDIIADLQAKLRALKRHRNGLSSISQLPDDLLVEIWKHLAYSRPQSKDWLGVTHVCSHWRQASINSPTLWQEPLFGTEEMTEEMIRRSRNMGLSFNIKLKNFEYHEYNQRRLKTIQEQIHNVKSLSLLGLQTSLEFKSAPLLTELSIISSYGKKLLNFFGGSCPNLTHVTLEDCELLNYPKSIQPLPRVTDLSIHASHGMPQVSFQQVIASLKRFPNLRRLSLQDVFSTGRAATEVDAQYELGNLQFPELEKLCLCAALEISLRFLDLIHYPTSASVLIKTYEWLGSEVSSILNSLISRFDSGPKILVVNLESGSERYNFLFNSPGDVSKPRGGRLTLQSATHLTAGTRAFLLLLPCLPILHDLQSLYFFAPAIGASEEFWRTCGNLPLLETLELECDQPDFLKILALPDSTDDGPMYFLSLRTLILHNNPNRHELFAEYSKGLNRGLTTAFAQECCRVAKVRKEDFHEMFEYKVLVI